MNRQDKMYTGALLVLMTGNKDVGKNDDLIDLVTNQGEEINKLESFFSEKSKAEIELHREISKVVNKLKMPLDCRALREDVIDQKELESQVIDKELSEKYNIQKNSSEREKVSILNSMDITVTSTSKEELDMHKEEPVIQLITRRSKLEDSMKLFKRLESSGKDGFIKPKFNIFGSLSGRIISHSPSLQNLPSYYKNYIQPLEEGDSIFELDVISAEIIALAFLASEDKIFQVLSERRDIYKFIGSNIFSKKESEITPGMRKIIKKMVNGINLGMAGSSVAKLLNEEEIVVKKITPQQGEKLRKKYLDLFPNMKEYLKEIMSADRLCTAHGHIFNVNPSYKNMSFPGQNLVATLLKETILELHKNNLWGHVVNIVHDSIIVSCPEEQIEKIKSVCQEIFACMIPDEFQSKNIELIRVTKIERGGK